MGRMGRMGQAGLGGTGHTLSSGLPLLFLFSPVPYMLGGAARTDRPGPCGNETATAWT